MSEVWGTVVASWTNYIVEKERGKAYNHWQPNGLRPCRTKFCLLVSGARLAGSNEAVDGVVCSMYVVWWLKDTDLVGNCDNMQTRHQVYSLPLGLRIKYYTVHTQPAG